MTDGLQTTVKMGLTIKTHGTNIVNLGPNVILLLAISPNGTINAKTQLY